MSFFKMGCLKETGEKIPAQTLQKARELRDQLLKTAASDVLLHGDLHHDNILQNSNDWVAIDPKGVIGEPAYEYWCSEGGFGI